VGWDCHRPKAAARPLKGSGDRCTPPRTGEDGSEPNAQAWALMKTGEETKMKPLTVIGRLKAKNGRE
jgi:hypothetical protein